MIVSEALALARDARSGGRRRSEHLLGQILAAQDRAVEALAAGADIVMLDNFRDDEVRDAIAVVDGHAIVEVSGGITIDRVGTLGAMGVDAISVGALTHSAPSSDLGLDWS